MFHFDINLNSSEQSPVVTGIKWSYAKDRYYKKIILFQKLGSSVPFKCQTCATR